MASIGEIIADIVERSAKGELVSRDSYMARFPQHSESLQKFFENFDLVDSVLGHLEGTPIRNSGRLIPFESRVRERGNSPEPGKRTPEELPRHFQVLEEIHRGAQGVVFKAVQRSTDRVVALKVLHSGTAGFFEREVKAAAGLRHPNVVTVYDAGIAEGRLYCAMELVEGLPLDCYLAAYPLDVKDKLHLFVKICSGVMHAHRHGIIHRDLKPSNILVESNGEPRVVDFGLATMAEVEDSQPEGESERSFGFVGTLPYASPEQLYGDLGEIDTRSDVYSLGVILYEMLAGARPYSLSDDRLDALMTINSVDPDPPSARCPGLDDDIDCIALKALRRNAAERYQSVELVVAEIKQYLRGQPITQKRDRTGYVLWRMAVRHRRVITLVAIGVFLLGALSSEFLSRITEQRTTAATTLRRFELAREMNLQTLHRYQASVASANRLREIAELPPDQIQAYMARYETPPLDPEGVFRPLVEGMPETLIDDVRSGQGQAYDDAVAWLEEKGPELDALAATLETGYFRFTVKAEPYFAVGWDPGPILGAAHVCSAFIARAYQHQAKANHSSAIADIRAATCLASDVGDGVLPEHKSFCYYSRNYIFGFLQMALTHSLYDDASVDYYTEAILQQPAIPAASTSLLPRRLGICELVNIALVSSPGSEAERIDVATLDQHFERFLQNNDALTEDNVKRLDAFGAGDLVALTDQYITSTEKWSTLTANEIIQQAGILTNSLLSERQTNPLLWFFSLPDAEFLMQLRTDSRRRALRLVAFARMYRATNGQWPEEINDAIPQDLINESIDRRTGCAFYYDITDDFPRIRSIPTRDVIASNNTLHIMEWMTDEDNLVTYFPSNEKIFSTDK